jgi:hypothetical protein
MFQHDPNAGDGISAKSLDQWHCGPGQTPIRHRSSSGYYLLENQSQSGRSLLSENREQEVSNHIHEGSAEKELGGEADDTEGNDDHENKKDNSAELRHGVDHSSVSVNNYASTHE